MARPFTVIMDLTARCNLKCVMCHFSQADRIHFPPFDLPAASDGNMRIDVFTEIAADLFPRARRVALACAAEPLIHPRFKEIVAIAGSYGVPDLWFPTNLLALSEGSARAILDANVRTVAASIDGLTKETYEKIRVGGKWERLLQTLELLRTLKREARRRRPGLRIIFTWMKSNFAELVDLPAFAADQGAEELDVRYVSPSYGVDVSGEVLDGEDPRKLRAILAATAREAVRRGLRLIAYPEFEIAEERSRAVLARIGRRIWRIRAGIDRPEHLRYMWDQRLHGCAYPDKYWVIRPNGAVSPCIYWQEEPIGIYPGGGRAAMASGAPLSRIREGLRSDRPVGSCAGCSERRNALYRIRGDEAGSPAPASLPTIR